MVGGSPMKSSARGKVSQAAAAGSSHPRPNTAVTPHLKAGRLYYGLVESTNAFTPRTDYK
ncbi:MAG: hypothetical protein DHS20C11_27220 [Lysobacteraceae bacterium]|nr:MAG: hypothetical protein DHS20C11_27220 [Xanthomonadaceae bacterium]